MPAENPARIITPMPFATDSLSGGWHDGDWSHGQTRRSVVAACCPQCGNLDVEHRGAREAGASLVYWQCRACSHRWKSADRKAGRVSTIQ